ncbi:3'-5' exonuclease [Acinetobacter nosocomialis]|uniref:3'-5' exonuclease n=1 Tax=Acinetobacter nosocomialis TaxID=106654 RepID=UPI0029DCA864|nr:3'-5' exonuclease [Acinetobacter nosocomialis]MDX7880483.1 3'-5' exonuclease [Acinetobacter nosocomialis]
MSALILDTETSDFEKFPIEIAHVPVSFLENGELFVDKDACFDEYFSCPEPISFGAMAVHHILESDLINKPSYETFRLPEGIQYIIGHNVDYDIRAIKLADKSVNAKAICTLALSRKVWPNEAHNLSALIYMLSKGSLKARESIRNAHNAKQDVLLTAVLLKQICKALGIKDMQSLYLFSEQARIPTKITFGKHKGMDIKDLPADYVIWLLNQDDLDPYLRKALKG